MVDRQTVDPARLFRQLLTYGIVVAPLLAWLAFGWWWTRMVTWRVPRCGRRRP